MRAGRAAVVVAAVCAAGAGARAEGETGRLVNATGADLTYRTGVPDEQGEVAWQEHTLAPCEAHDWSWDFAGEPNVAMTWPRFVDQRKDEAGGVIVERTNVPMSATGAVSVFFIYGDQIWINTTGDTSACPGL